MLKSEVQRLPLNNLICDPRVQRPLDQRRVNKIAAEFNAEAVGVITVSRRDNGDHIVLDGQHRAAAAREAGQSSSEVTCRVFTGLTLAQEAELFRLLNNTAKPMYLDIFRVRVIEGDADAVAVTDILDRHGWSVSASTSEGQFGAVQAFERLYKRDTDHQPNAAEFTIATITAAWGHIPAGVDNRIVDGLGQVFLRYRDQIEPGDLIERLAKFPGGPGALLGRARGLRDLRGTRVSQAVAEIVVEVYNTRRRTKALPPWRA